jgi:hypothetical protein
MIILTTLKNARMCSHRQYFKCAPIVLFLFSFFPLKDAGKNRAWIGPELFISGAPSSRQALGIATTGDALYVFGGQGTKGKIFIHAFSILFSCKVIMRRHPISRLDTVCCSLMQQKLHQYSAPCPPNTYTYMIFPRQSFGSI